VRKKYVTSLICEYLVLQIIRERKQPYKQIFALSLQNKPKEVSLLIIRSILSYAAEQSACWQHTCSQKSVGGSGGGGRGETETLPGGEGGDKEG
jgi:hypothetical protein